MGIEYFFDTKGKWIAFKKEKYLFNSHARWIGWFPKEGLAVDTDGKYLGTVYLKDRLLVNLLQKRLPYPGYPGHPGYTALPPDPGYGGVCEYVPNTEDIKSKRLD